MIVSTIDFEKLIQLVTTFEYRRKTKFKTLQLLKNKIMSAQKVEPNEIPPDIVTMNSIVKIKIANTNSCMNVKLVYPEFENIRENKISIYSALGTAIFLGKVGDSITYKTWKSDNHVKILNIIFQPEANEDLVIKKSLKD